MKLESTNSVSIVALASGWMMIYADRLSISPLLNVIRNEFGLNFAQVSLIVSAYFITYVAFTIPSMLVAERFGYKKTMIAFLALAGVSLGIAGVIGYTYFLLLLFISIHGVGAGAYYPTAYKISTEFVPKGSRGFSSALVNSGMAFGTILGLIVAGPILSIFADWQVVFIILAIPTMLVAGSLYGLIPSESKIATKTTPQFHMSQLKQVLKNRNIAAISVAMFCSLYGYWVILTWGPSFLQETRGLNVFYSGLVTGLFAAIAIPSSILISRHSDKVGRKRISIVILAVTALTVFLMAYSSSLVEFLASIVVYGIVGKLTLDPIAIAWVSDVVEPHLLGSSLAILNVVAMSSSILAPVITGAIADSTGTLATGFYLGAVVVLLGSLSLVFSKEKTRAEDSS